MIEGLIIFIKEQVLVNDVFGAAFWLTIFGTIAYQLKAVPIFLWDKIKYYAVYTCYIEETDDLFYMLERWLQLHYTEKYRNVEASIKERRDIIDNKEIPASDARSTTILKIPKIFYKQFASDFWILYKATPLKIFKGREKLDGAKDVRSVYLNHFTIKGLRAKKIVDKMLKEVTEKYANDKKIEGGVDVKIRDYGSWTSMFKLRPRLMDSVVIEPKLKAYAIKTIDNFIENKKWFRDRSIPYKLGIVLYGSPGNGKTSFIKALATKYNKNIYFLNIQGCSNDQFENLFHRVETDSILVIEDIDSAFKDKRNLKTNKNTDQVSFVTLLNCLDGIISKEGSMTIFTTNHIDRLDPALIRPGRVDFKMKFDNPGINEVKTYFKMFYGQDLKTKKLKYKHSMAKLQQMFIEYKDEPDKARGRLER